ncbi:YggT family protein [Gammaproteobacteria bacterium ESL0073]|nr:YggT family protein [Gammaproteobacteria bacterium ESL0073]
MTGFTSTLLYIIRLLGEIYISIILLRFLLQMVRADFYNPISQFIVNVTHPLLKPLRQIIPSIGRQDIASLVLAYLVQMVLTCILLLIIGIPFGAFIAKVPIIALINLLEAGFYLLFLLFIGNAILSWIAPDSRAPAAILIQQICYFILAPLRRIIPPIGIFDITPMIALLLLFFFNNFIIGALASYIVPGL